MSIADLSPLAFFDPAALALVGGGTLLATVLRAPLRDLGGAVVGLARLPRRAFDAAPLVDQVAALSRIARRHGVIALDRSVIADPDVAQAVAAVVDGASADEVGDIVRQARRARAERQLAAAECWAGMAEVAPAMGMVGTLVGLVRMFAAMKDPATIGAAMATALLATLYGALIANLLAQPIAVRLRRRARDEALERMRFEAPLVALAAREAPRTVKLTSAA